MDPILIGTAVSEVSYTNFIALVPSRQTFVGRERAQLSRCKRLQNPGRNQKFLPASSLTYRNIPQNALSLLDNSLNIHHFGMRKVDWLSWRSWFYSGTKFAPRSWIFFKNFEVKLAAGASKFRPKTDIVIGVQATYKHTVVHNEPDKYHKFYKQCRETVLQVF